MTRLLLSLAVLTGFCSLSTNAEIIDHARIMHCDYKYIMMPAASIDIGFWSDNEPQTSLMLTMGMGGSSEKKTVTPVPLANDEMAHATISKEVANGSLELIIYAQPQAQGNSRLINHNFSQEFWGTCR